MRCSPAIPKYLRAVFCVDRSRRCLLKGAPRIVLSPGVLLLRPSVFGEPSIIVAVLMIDRFSAVLAAVHVKSLVG